MRFRQIVSLWLIIVSLFFGLGIQAAPYCLFFYSSTVESSHKTALLRSLRNRLELYLDKTFEPTQQHGSGQNRLPSETARQILAILSVKGSTADIKIFNLYLSILENTPGSKRLFLETARDNDLAARFLKSNIFQESHWDWNNLYDYFFVSPLSLDFHREQDIIFLEHVLQIAKTTKSAKTLREILQESNHTWALDQLARFPDVAEQYRAYTQSKSHTELYLELKDHFGRWAQASENQMVRGKRWEQVSFILESLRISNTAFDFFVASKYLDAIKIYFGKNDTASFEMPLPSFQMTDWDMHSVGLPLGNIDTLNLFLKQNSHDVINKAYTARVLNLMTEISPRLKGKNRFNFRDAYSIARKIVDKQVIRIPAPDFYQSDLHIYDRNKNPDLTTFDDIEQIWVRWNPIWGRPTVNVVERYPYQLNQNATVSSMPQLYGYVRRYFENSRKSNTYRKEEIDFDEQMELNAKLADTTYFIFTHPDTYVLLTMARLFHAKESKTFIEREFPHLEIPERKTGENIFELGRLLATEEADGKSLESIMARVAEYLKFKNLTGVIYLNASEAGMRYYRRVGAKMVYTPQQLNQTPGSTPLWVMKYTVADFIRQFLKPDYKTVRTRRN